MKIYKDGNMWCCMHGENIQEGRCGFGRLKIVAILRYLIDCMGLK